MFLLNWCLLIEPRIVIHKIETNKKVTRKIMTFFHIFFEALKPENVLYCSPLILSQLLDASPI